MDSDGLVFGLLPANVLRSITEVGNWKARSNAIEQVQCCLANLEPGQSQVLLQHLPEFVAFVKQLLQDHNFKVVSAGLYVLGDAACSLSTTLQQYSGELTPLLLDKLCDHRAPVASAALRAATLLMQHMQPNSPAALVNRLLQLHNHEQHVTAGRDCSGVLELLVLAMLKCPINSLDLPAAARLVLACLQQRPSSTDSSNTGSSSRQRALALEACALATDNLGAQLPNLLKQAGGSDLTVTQVLMQVQQLQRPLLAADGSIQHNSAVQAAAAAAEAASLGGSGSFLIGAGMYDRTNNSSGSSSKGDDSLGSRYAGLGSKRGVDGDPGVQDAAGSTSRPHSCTRMQEQMMPPGSLGALAAHARLVSSAASSIAAAAASCGGSKASNGLVPGTAQPTGQGLEGRYCNALQTASGAGSSSHAVEHPYSVGQSPLGSPRGLPGTSSSNRSSMANYSCSHLQRSCDKTGQAEGPGSPRWRPDPSQTTNSVYQQNVRGSGSINSRAAGAAGTEQQLHSGSLLQQQEQEMQDQLSSLQLYESSRYASNSRDLQPARDAAMIAAGTDSSAGGIAAKHQPGVAAADAPTGPVHNLRYQQPYCSSNSGTPRRTTGDQQSLPHCLDALQAPAGSVIAAGSAAGGGGGGGNSSGSWLATAGPGWATNDAAGSETTCNAGCSGRVETLSPSRGERLANLKRRQVEKRAVSATGSTRSSFPWDSQDAALTAAAAAGGGGEGSCCASPSVADAVPRAATAGPAPVVGSNSLGWRFSSTPESLGSSAEFAQAGYRLSTSPAPGEMGPGSSSSRAAPLLQWHIPTGPGGRIMPPGAAVSPSQQQWQQAGLNSKGAQVLPATSTSWDTSSMPVGRAFQSSSGSVASGSSPTGQMLQHVQRTTSAVAVLTSTGADSSSHADSPVLSSTGATQHRSSRFQQQRSGSSSPAGNDGTAAAGAPLGASRLHGGNTSSAGFNRQDQQQQQQSLSMRAQTAAPMLGGATAAGSYQPVSLPAGEWGTGTSSSPVGRGSSAGGPGGNGVLCSIAGSPTRSRGGSGLRSFLGGERPQSVGCVADADLVGAELAPLPDPESSLRSTVSRLQQANSATRKEVDWQAQLEALVDARRLLAHHTEMLRGSARELVLAALPAVDELRSTTARMALLFFQELSASGLGVERELDEVVPVLLKKAGDLSTAGRDNFLAQEADKALSLICSAVSESKALSALIAAGASHKSPHVRSRAAAHLDEVAAGGAGLEALLRSGNWAVLDKLFKTAAAFLQEGSLDTRTYGKRLLWAVKAVLRGNRSDMDRLMAGITPEGVHRRVGEVLEGLSAPPPAPTSRSSSSAGPRLASRGQASACSTPTSGSLCGAQPAPPFSAPPASLYNIAGASAAGQDAYNACRSGYSSVGSTSGGSNSARRALFGSAAGTTSATWLQIQGASAGAGPGGSPGSPQSPTLSSSASRRRRSIACGLADGSRGPGSPQTPGSASSGGAGGAAGAWSSSGSASFNDRRSSGGCPAGPPGPMSPELQEAVDQVGVQLCSKDWRNRMDALRALSALGPALPEVPNAPLEGLLQALIGRLSDGNAKVNQKALEVLCEVVHTIQLRALLIMPNLLPALTANMGSTNDKIRSSASSAFDVVAAAVSLQPQLLMQGMAQAVANGSARTKLAVIDKLSVLLPAVHGVQPQLTRLLLPAAFSLALEARGEVKAAAAQLVGGLASLLGSSAVLSAAANVSAATEQRVRELMLGLGGRS